MDTKMTLLPANKQENSKGHANYGWDVSRCKSLQRMSCGSWEVYSHKMRHIHAIVFPSVS